MKEGYEFFNLLVVPVAHLDEKYDQDWKKLKQIAREGVIRRLEQAGLTDIELHIMN